ncbi:MAG: nitroreductase family protein [Anaerolineae bacterium]|jgi:nitroreductase
MLDLIKKRRSVRSYTHEPVSDASVRALLEAAMAAPSADNSQPWEFVVVRRESLRRQLAQTHPWSRMCAGAAVVFVVCAHERRSSHWVEDASAATENLLLAAAGLDLGAVWVGVYPNSRYETHVRQVLDIPAGLRVLCLVPVGHPAQSKPPRTQYNEGRVHYDGY